jgi:hypothetical protein
VAPAIALADTENPSLAAQFVADINSARSAAGLPAYAVVGDLTGIAQQHSDEMAARQQLYHNPNLTSQVQDWQEVGENVGTGPSVPSIHQAFMNSPEHRANILDPHFTQVGVGVTVDSQGELWVTEDFREPMQAAAPVAPTAPAPPTVAASTTQAAASTSSLTSVATPRVAAAPTPAQVLAHRLSWLGSHVLHRAAVRDPVAQAVDYVSVVTALAAGS